MKIQRFFLHEKLEEKNSITITSDVLVNQLRNVFRFVKGDRVVLFDNSGYDFYFDIVGLENNSIQLEKAKTQENTILPEREAYLFASIVKKDNFEWIAQKATELGVSHIIPIVSDRSEKKDLNMERMQKIIIEAAEQSGRGTLPVICEVTDLATTLDKYAHIKSIAWEPDSIKFVSQDLVDTLGAYIGPEGGWSIRELALFKQHNIRIRSLGPQILKSETAAIATLTQLVF